MSGQAMSDPYQALEDDLRAGPTATAMLARRTGTPVHAVVLATDAPIRTATRMRLGTDDVGYRRVQLIAGGRVMSEAENWYARDRLTPAMRAALTDGDVPFGQVIAALDPRREILDIKRFDSGPHAMEVHAMVFGGDGLPLAEVIEHYARALLGEVPEALRRAG
jgi:chorismate-pyruvate lyase